MLLQAFSPECNVIIQNTILLPICCTETYLLSIGLICFVLRMVFPWHFDIHTYICIMGFPFRDFDVLFLDYAEQHRSHPQLLQFVFSKGSEIIFPRTMDNFNFLFATKKFWCGTFLAQTNFVFRFLDIISSIVFRFMPINFLLTFKEWARDILSIFSSLVKFFQQSIYYMSYHLECFSFCLDYTDIYVLLACSSLHTFYDIL